MNSFLKKLSSVNHGINHGVNRSMNHNDSNRSIKVSSLLKSSLFLIAMMFVSPPPPLNSIEIKFNTDVTAPAYNGTWGDAKFTEDSFNAWVRASIAGDLSSSTCYFCSKAAGSVNLADDVLNTVTSGNYQTDTTYWISTTKVDLSELQSVIIGSNKDNDFETNATYNVDSITQPFQLQPTTVGGITIIIECAIISPGVGTALGVTDLNPITVTVKATQDGAEDSKDGTINVYKKYAALTNS